MAKQEPDRPVSPERLDQLIKESGGGGKLARIAQVDPGTVSKWKAGTVPNGAQLYRICMALGHSVAWVFGASDEEVKKHLGRALQKEVIDRPERPPIAEFVPERTRSVRESFNASSSAPVPESPTQVAHGAQPKRTRKRSPKSPKPAG